MHTYSSIFARRLRAERTRRGLSQAEVARRIGQLLDVDIDTSAISRIESPDSGRVVKLDEAAAAADALDLPLAALLSDREQVDEEIGELERDLSLAEYRAGQAAGELEQARESVAAIERRIAELKRERRS